MYGLQQAGIHIMALWMADLYIYIYIYMGEGGGGGGC